MSQDESLIVPVSVQGTNLQGVLDCGAGACIIRREIYEALNPKPPVLRRIYLRGVGENLTPGFEIEITVHVGSTTYCGPAYVATMNDDFLLGLHFMKATRCDILMSESCIRFGGEHGEKVPAVLKQIEHRDYQISRVVVAHRVVVPPNTIKVAQVKLLDSVDEDQMFCVEPHMKNKGLLISATVSPGKSKVPVQIINDLNRFVTLRAGHLVGIATEIHEIIEKGPDIHTTDGVITPEPKVSTSSTSDCSQSEEVLVTTTLSSKSDCSQSAEDIAPPISNPDCIQSGNFPLNSNPDCIQSGTLPLKFKSDCNQSDRVLLNCNPDCSQSGSLPSNIHSDCIQSDTLPSDSHSDCIQSGSLLAEEGDCSQSAADSSFKVHLPIPCNTSLTSEETIKLQYTDCLLSDSMPKEATVFCTETESPKSESASISSIRQQIPE